AAKARGTQWQRGGMGNLRWKGVRLKRLLDSLEMVIDPGARFLTAEGRDSPTSPAGADFEQCVPLDDVLEAALLATQMNGEPIPAIHGGPVRLILPGYYGSMNVKWLSRLRFEAQASQNRHHTRRYRTFVERVEPGSAPAVTTEATVPTWRQKVKSVIWNPVEGARLAAGPVEVSGVAWNDGRTEIVAVEVSGDGGETWRRADFEAPSSPYGWHPWRHTLELPSGVAEIRVRAADAVGRGQPLDGSVHWNPSGYEWYGADGIRVTVG
ncbi:MAG: molybdopterin-dependent oxidoreductase, partial [bacterium]|nr:molybdopterin-dependent oxidoreductase [bacterium]